MDLKTFVAESLSQILAGIKEAQSRPNGDHIAPESYISSQGNLLAGGTSGYYTVVDFDVSVLAESREGAGSVRVASVEVSEGSAKTAQNTSRVKFSVHVKLPKGGTFTQEDRGNYRATVSDGW